MNTNTTADVRQTAAAMRVALKATFPGTKFSVTMARGTAYGWLRVAWTDGPTSAQVEETTGRFQNLRFSGTDDSYHSTGVVDWSCRGVTTSRRLSPERIAAARALVRMSDAGPFIDHDGTHVYLWPTADTDMVARVYCQQIGV